MSDLNHDAKQAVAEGPITGGSHGWPFGGYVGDPGEKGYVEEEYFLSGHATAYSPISALGVDGRWDVEPAGTAPYTTRILVRRPTDAAKFNGVVLVEWNNVTSGYELSSADSPSVYAGGYALVIVSAQEIGFVGFAAAPQGLLSWDEERYGRLLHPGDSYSYDIFTQAARAVGPNRPSEGSDPLGGLEVKRVIASGMSQSAMRLMTYANSIYAHERVIDGMVIALLVGSGYTFTDARVDATMLAEATPEQLQAILGTPTGFRTDLTLPVIIVNTECEAELYANVRQPDSHVLRYWEIAGAAHAPGPSLRRMAAALERDFGEPFAMVGNMTDTSLAPSEVDWMPVYDAALGHLRSWIDDGTLPPSQPRIEIGEDGHVVRDENGNAIGGIRLAEVEVPVATYNGGGVGPGTIGLSGSTTPFDAEKLARLYPTHDEYVRAVERASEAAVERGVITPELARESTERARLADVPA